MTVFAGYYALGTGITNTGSLQEATTYTRPTVTLTGTAATGLTQSLAALTGTTPTGPSGAPITRGAIFDSLTGGNALVYWDWAQPYAVIGTSDFAAVTINIQFNTYVSQALTFSLGGGEASSGSTIDAGAQIGTIGGLPLIAASKLVILSGNLYVQSLGAATGQQSVPTNVNLVMQGTGQVIQTATTGITAGTTRTQAGATVLTSQINRVDTTTAATAGTNASDGVKLMAAAAGSKITIINNTANSIKVYGNGSDTVNGMTNTVGVLMHPNTSGEFFAATTGGWQGTSVSQQKAGYTALTNTTNATLTAANITTGTDLVVVNMSGNIGSGQTLTLPTVAATVAAMHMPVAGRSFVLRLLMTGTGAFAWTVTTAAGWTLTAGGTMTLTGPQAYQDYLVNLSSLTAGTLQHIAGNLTTAFVI